MKEVILKIEENRELCNGVFELTLTGDVEENKAGQFVEVALRGFTLRRPFGVVRSEKGKLVLLYRVAGVGTKFMATLNIGETLNVLVELGNGFGMEKAKKPLLIGGGIGLAPLYKLAEDFKKAGKKPIVLLGFRTKDEVFYHEEFAKLGTVFLTTDDGSLGYKGNTIDYILNNKIDYDFYYACGPTPMLKALQTLPQKGELSLEARMACGFGACMGCSIMTTAGSKRVCKEGPVFAAEEVVF